MSEQAAPAISVIMLTCNREQLMIRAIEHVLNQTFEDFEFIIVDNGSADNSGRIADSCSEQDRRIRVLHRTTADGSLSIGAGRNAGLSLAKGTWIAFMDDDDYAEPDYLEFLYGLVTANNADIAFSGSYIEPGGAPRISQFCRNELLLLSPEQAVIELCERRLLNASTPTKLFRASLFNGLQFEEDSPYDDISLVYRLFASARLVAAQCQPLYTFTRHGANNSAFTDDAGLISTTVLEEYLRVYQERAQWLKHHLPEVGLYAEYSEWSFWLSMHHKIVSQELIGLEEQERYLRQRLEAKTSDYNNGKWDEWIKPFERQWLRELINPTML